MQTIVKENLVYKIDWVKRVKTINAHRAKIAMRRIGEN